MSGVKVILSLAFSKERVEGMKVLMLNGSAKKEGNTYQSLLEVGKELERQGIESSVHRSIMHIQVDGSCHFWTEYFTAAAEHLPSNRRLL